MLFDKLDIYNFLKGTQTTIQECIAEICCICGEENSDNTLTVLR